MLLMLIYRDLRRRTSLDGGGGTPGPATLLFGNCSLPLAFQPLFFKIPETNVPSFPPRPESFLCPCFLIDLIPQESFFAIFPSLPGLPCGLKAYSSLSCIEKRNLYPASCTIPLLFHSLASCRSCPHLHFLHFKTLIYI